MEQVVIVDNHGTVKRFSIDKILAQDENTAVELVAIYLQHRKQIVLFNRAAGASDMHDHWALESGKVNVEDLPDYDTVIGTKLPLEAYKNAAIRELREELNFEVAPEAFEWIDEFLMESKHIYFNLLALALDEADLSKLSPNQSEVDKIRCFTLDEFASNPHLGDAIQFRKNEIIRYLQRMFGV